ncbi:MAG: molybdenum transporter, periplasmic molybdate-binding protein [Bacillus sp. (in: firmicutes)]|jgi:molybdate transport system substrate-binding protein|nr:molybdenum transporter, periplasmic molybdate-binding protein [Bacillus sp. (in: firmicutes)]
MKYSRYFIIFITIILLSACTQNGEQKEQKKNVTLTISAAASLQNVLIDIQKEFKKEYPSVSIVYNFGGSGTLQQQILKGAPIDLYIFADEKKAKQLMEKGLVEKDTAKNLLGNQLVLIQSNSSKTPISNIEDLIHNDIKKIAIGTPETVPAGKYTKQALEQMRLWSQLENKMVPTKDVRQVLTYVETGNVDAGFVYLTDAIDSKKIKIVTEVPEESHDLIIYPTGIINTSKHKHEASLFSSFLESEQAKKIYNKHRFIVLD